MVLVGMFGVREGGSKEEVWLWKGEMKFCSCSSIGDGKFGVH